MARKNVPASAVRDFLLSDEGLAARKALSEENPKVAVHVGPRGRFQPEHIALFHKHNKNSRYETASEVEKPTVAVTKVPFTDSRGRASSKTVTITTEKARALLGHEKGRKGRFNMADLRAALATEVANESGRPVPAPKETEAPEAVAV